MFLLIPLFHFHRASVTLDQTIENKRDSLHLWQMHWTFVIWDERMTDIWGPSSSIEFFRAHAYKEKILWEMPLRIIWERGVSYEFY